MEDDLAGRLMSQPAGCALWPEQTEGPYHRDASLEREDITEDRPGVALRLGLRLVTAAEGVPLAGVPVEIWHADHEGRYSGFKPFRAQPGQVVTSDSVPRDIVAPDETFLRGVQRTDARGLCGFHTIYPGWYSSRAVHIHVQAHFGERTATTQLYFPEAITDDVHAVAPYAGRPHRDTTNPTDSIFNTEGGEDAVLHVKGSADEGYTGVVCFAVAMDPR